jgi:hypothetical protein
MPTLPAHRQAIESVTPSWYRPRSGFYWTSLLAFGSAMLACLSWIALHEMPLRWGGGVVLLVEGALGAFSLWKGLLYSRYRARDVEPVREGIRVDALVLVCPGDSPATLNNAIRRCQHLWYPHRTRVVDTGKVSDPGIKTLCDELGVDYLHAATGIDKRGGADFVALFGCDSVPAPDFFHRTLSYFEDEQVAVVQTQALFSNPDGWGGSGFCRSARGWGLTSSFCQVLQPALDARDMAIWTGTGAVLRCSSFFDAGMDMFSQVSPLGETNARMSTFRLMATGLRVVYHPQPLHYRLLASNVEIGLRSWMERITGSWQAVLCGLKGLSVGERSLSRALLAGAMITDFVESVARFVELFFPILLIADGGGTFSALPVAAVLFLLRGWRAVLGGQLVQGRDPWRIAGPFRVLRTLLEARVVLGWSRVRGAMIRSLTLEVRVLGGLLVFFALIAVVLMLRVGLTVGLLMALVFAGFSLFSLARVFPVLRRPLYPADEATVPSVAPVRIGFGPDDRSRVYPAVLLSEGHWWIKAEDSREWPVDRSAELVLETESGLITVVGRVKGGRDIPGYGWVTPFEISYLGQADRNRLWDHIYSVECPALARLSARGSGGRVEFPLPYGTLLILFRWTQSSFFGPIHRAFRWFYSGPVVWVVRGVMRACVAVPERRSVEVVVRHSASTGEGFNIFGSDLDLTVLTDRPLSSQRADLFLRAHGRLRWIAPFLGELEFFSKDEWALIQSLQSRHGELLRFFRDLKKIGWMERDLESRVDLYHRYKLKSSIRKLLVRLEGTAPELDEIRDRHNRVFLGKGFERRLRELTGGVDARVILGEAIPRSLAVRSQVLLEWVRSPCESLIPGGIGLEVGSALTLLALLPSHWQDDPEVVCLLDILRQSDQLRPLHVAVLQYELLYAQASPRMYPWYRATFHVWADWVSMLLQRWGAEGGS